MNLKGIILTTLILLFLIAHVQPLQADSAGPLHLASNPQLQGLLVQQGNFQTAINALVKNVVSFQAQFNATQNVTAKIDLLQTAITNESLKMAQLQQSIMPSYNNSIPACQDLTSSQKTALSLQLNSTKLQLPKLQALASNLPANQMLTQIKMEISKQQMVIK